MNGINLLCPDGQRRLCHPILCQYIADYQEQFLISCITNGCCPKCKIPRYASKVIMEIEPESSNRKRKRSTTEKGNPKPKQNQDRPRQKRVTLPESGDIFRQYPLRTIIDSQEARVEVSE